jgi:hypothetical protein
MAFQNFQQGNGMNPLLVAALPGVLSGISSIFNNNSQEKMTKEQLSEQQRQFEEQLRQRRGEQALNATQLDPLVQQRSRQLNALMSSLLQNSSRPTMDAPGSGMQYDFSQMASLFSPQARENAERQFTSNAQAASGGQYQGPSGVGYAGATAPVPDRAPITPVAPTPHVSFFDKIRARLAEQRPQAEAMQARLKSRPLSEILRNGARP